MDIAELDALPRGTEVFVRLSLTGKDRENGWYTTANPMRAGALPRHVNHLDVECVAPARPIVSGDRVMRGDGTVHNLRRTVLFIHGDMALTETAITNRLEIVPVAELSRIA